MEKGIIKIGKLKMGTKKIGIVKIGIINIDISKGYYKDLYFQIDIEIGILGYY